jgi:hypothetical protein
MSGMAVAATAIEGTDSNPAGETMSSALAAERSEKDLTRGASTDRLGVCSAGSCYASGDAALRLDG